MAFDGKLLAIARESITRARQARVAEIERRRSLVLSRAPTVLEAEAEIALLMTELATTALQKGLDAGAAVAAASAQVDRLLARRTALLIAAGFPADFIDEQYDCPDCRDTGYVLGKPCICLKKLYEVEAVRELSSMLNLQDQCFERFNLGYYDSKPEAASGVSPREVMAYTLEICREYAENFGEKAVNLLFRGGTGLGKTFLAASIARVVSHNGYSVVYDTVVSILAAFELQKFDRAGAEAEEASARVRRYLDCELLILDDLGTEMTTSFTQSALYSLVNGRLLRGGKTIVTTNLSQEELQRRYSPQLASRLEGEYITLHFAGRDIRALRREQGLG